LLLIAIQVVIAEKGDRTCFHCCTY